MLASELFSRSERLSALLRFVVEETLNGRGDTLKEAVLAHQLYGKDADFDGASNPIVRVDARRLRDKLREYYADATADPVVISLPKGNYVPAFELTAGAASAADIPSLAGPTKPPDTVSPGSPAAVFGDAAGPAANVRLAWRCSGVGNAGTRRRRLRSAFAEYPPRRPVGSCWWCCRLRT